MKLDIFKLKPLLGIAIDDMEQDSRLEFTLMNVEEIICNYCNVSTLPDGLLNTAYRMAMDLYRNEQIGSNATENQVSSIEEGDTKVAFSSSPYDSSFADSLLKNYTAQLNRYRRMTW